MAVVYLDVVWLVNLVMDAVLLGITCWIAKRPLKVWRILLGAFIGAMYALLLFFPPLTPLTAWPGKALVSLLMVYAAMPIRRWLELARMSALYYLVSFVMAGAAIALHFAVPGSSISKGIVANHKLEFGTSLGSLGLLVAIPLTAALIRYALGRVRKIHVRANELYNVQISVDGVNVSFTGLMDTGNQLRDPVTRKPVCLVEAKALLPLLPKELVEIYESGGSFVEGLARLSDETFARRVSLIPYRGAGGTQQLTIAIRPDSMDVEKDGRRRPAKGSALFALHRDGLSIDGQFQAILHTDVITGDDGFEDTVASSQFEHQTTHPTAAFGHQNSSKGRGRL